MTGDGAPSEGRAGVGRIEAFSDGVFAVIITIMVLDLHAPATAGLDALLRLWPTFLAYVLSYAYVAIYWVNHHRLFSHALRVTNRLVWCNIALLFGLSLVPFATAYLGVQNVSREAVMIYLVAMLLPALAYTPLQSEIRRTGRQDAATARYHAATGRKGMASTLCYLLGLPLSLVSPWLGIGCAGLVAVLWFLPNSPLDRIFLRG